MQNTATARGKLDLVRELYEGGSQRAQRFRYAVLIFDLSTIAFVIATSFTAHGRLVEMADAIIGLLILSEFLARLAIARQKLRFFAHPAVLADLVVIASFLAPLAGEGLGFLRIVRTVRLLHTYQVVVRLRADFAFFRKHEDVVNAAVNLFVFIFLMTGLVYASQYQSNPGIKNYVDALYFTVTALTTTGFGDITLTDTFGRLISVAVMIFGVTLFLRLAQVMLRPPKVRLPCTECGLILHDADAVHCKHCGAVMNIPDEGLS